MREYLNGEDIDTMGLALKVYDVDQNGWEHEDKGIEFNVNHVLKELVRAERKDFFDPEVVRDELAPDAMQYAFRLARWTGFKRELVLPPVAIKDISSDHAKLMRTASRRIGAYAAGELILGDFTHRLDHASEREEALQLKFTVLPKVSQALMLFALDSANEFNFNPKNSFIDRLTNLRERFGIPHPIQ